jgi:hypothetical protein
MGVKKWDLVFIDNHANAADTGLVGNCRGIALHTYKEKHGGTDGSERWCLYIRNRGSLAWYKEEWLEILDNDRWDLQAVWAHDMGEGMVE